MQGIPSTKLVHPFDKGMCKWLLRSRKAKNSIALNYFNAAPEKFIIIDHNTEK